MSAVSAVGLLLGPELETVATGAGACPSLREIGDLSVWLSVRDTAGSPADTAVRVRSLCEHGVRTLFVVDTAEAIRPDWAVRGGRFAVVADHLNLTGDNPLVGPNDSQWGPRFPDLTDAWDPALRAILRHAALDRGFDLREGVVAGLPGSARTAAELRMLRMLGADMASAGFVAEAITGRHAGRRMVGLAVLFGGADLSGDMADLVSLLDFLVPALEEADAPE
jgi:purine nucleoside phosphorylase